MNQIVKLKSKTMIELYSGYDELEISHDFDTGEFDCSNISFENISEEEKKLIEEDILNIIKSAGNKLKAIELPKIDDDIALQILKQSYTSDITFDGIDVFFEKMKNTTTKLLPEGLYEKTKKFLKRDEISEYDLFKYIKFGLEVNHTTITADEFKTISKFIPDDYNLEIKVSSNEEIGEVLAIKNSNNSFWIDIKDLYKIEKNKDFDSINGITIVIDNMSELDLEELLRIKSEYNISNIFVEDDCYDLDTYAKLRGTVDEIIKGIDIDRPDIEKFTKIYERLGHKIKYDNADLEYNETSGSSGRYNKNAHNLKGALLEDLSVCEGISKTLNQCLSCVNIEAEYISGNSIKKEAHTGHAWNKIKIDNTWYNADLTWDLQNISDGSTPNYCLQSTEEFQHEDYEAKTNNHTTDITYDQDELCGKYFSGRRFMFEHEKNLQYSSTELLEMIKSLKESKAYVSDEINVKFDGDFIKENGYVYISNIFDGNEIESDCMNSISMKNEEIKKLIEVLISKQSYMITKINEDGSTRISIDDNVNFIFNEEMKEALENIGLDIDTITDSKYEITASTLIKKIQAAKEDENQEKLKIEIRNSFFRK